MNALFNEDKSIDLKFEKDLNISAKFNDADDSFSGVYEAEKQIDISFSESREVINSGFGELSVVTLLPEEVPRYKGKYSVIPDVEPVTLKTKNKLMENDVTVFKIPLWQVSNTSGTTIYIGGENIYGD